jgi:hypothetical protein
MRLVLATLCGCCAAYKRKVANASWVGAREPSACMELKGRSYVELHMELMNHTHCLELWGDFRSVWEAYDRYELQHARPLADLLDRPDSVTDARWAAMLAWHAAFRQKSAAFVAAGRARLTGRFPLSSRLGRAMLSVPAKATCLLANLVLVVVAARPGGRARGLGWRAQLALALFAHYYMDLFMGTVHMALDSPTLLHYPALGTYVTWFQYHHSSPSYDDIPWPTYLFGYGVEQLVAMQTLPLLLAVHALTAQCSRRGGPGAGGAAAAGVRRAAWSWAAHWTVMGFMALVAHRCCHGSVCPQPMPLLQRAGLLMSRAQHRRHHGIFEVKATGLHLTTMHASKGEGYGWSFYNGWADKLLDAITTDGVHYTDGVRVLWVVFAVLSLPVLVFAAAAALCSRGHCGGTALPLEKAAADRKTKTV